MDLLLICRDALASSLIGNLLVAMEAKKAGSEVAVLFTQEALAAVAGGTFSWPRELSGQEFRLRMADSGSAMGLPLMGRGEGRQLDPRKMVAKAREAGVPMYACPIWTGLLGLRDKLPEGVQAPEPTEVFKMLSEARTIIGSF